MILFINKLPIELIKYIKEYVIFKPKSNEELRDAVQDFYYSDYLYPCKYGHISLWNTILITDMFGLFENCRNFNENINNWNMSNVVDIDYMFKDCTEFNQPLNNWNTSKVTTMESLFENCSNFNQL